MKKIFVTSLSILIFSCLKADIVQYNTKNTDPATFASGQQLPVATRSYTNFCNPNGWGRKGCEFLAKYDGTFWADTENYYSDFSCTNSTLSLIKAIFISYKIKILLVQHQQHPALICLFY